jgi:hypothetical protein
MAALTGQRRCYNHSKHPIVAAQRSASKTKGGRAAKKVTPAKTPADVSSVEKLQEHLSWELGHVQNLPISSRRAAAAARLIREAARLLELVELRNRVEALEEKLGVRI